MREGPALRDLTLYYCWGKTNRRRIGRLAGFRLNDDVIYFTCAFFFYSRTEKRLFRGRSVFTMDCFVFFSESLMNFLRTVRICRNHRQLSVFVPPKPGPFRPSAAIFQTCGYPAAPPDLIGIITPDLKLRSRYIACTQFVFVVALGEKLPRPQFTLVLFLPP